MTTNSTASKPPDEKYNVYYIYCSRSVITYS